MTQGRLPMTDLNAASERRLAIDQLELGVQRLGELFRVTLEESS